MTNKSKYNPKIHHRRSIRLKGYDYSQAGLYYITICCKNREYRFGDVVNGEMRLNDAGKMVENEWLKLPQRFKNIQLHEFVVMPNHFHAILQIVEGATLVVAPMVVAQNGQSQGVAPMVVAQNGQSQGVAPMVVAQNGQPLGVAPTDNTKNRQSQGVAPTSEIKNKTLGDIVGAFKSIVTVEYIRGVKTLGWQPFNGKLWQRDYWERIIRDERAYHTISKYIVNNPAKWIDDKFYRI
jgi:putative transposase